MNARCFFHAKKGAKMEHKHSVLDKDTHFLIDPVTRAITTTSEKLHVMQYDHNSERLTFEMPRYIEGHDMSVCNKVEVHFLNIDGKTKDQISGHRELEDFRVSEDDESKVAVSWNISKGATKLGGKLNFLLNFRCVEDGVETYAWHTDFFTNYNVKAGLDAAALFESDYADVIEQWKASVMKHFTDDLTAWKADTLKTLIEEYAEKIDYVTPQMFGAKGDGATDDTEAIRTALEVGKIVYVPKGIYKTTSQIDIPSGKSMILEGTVFSLSGIPLEELKKQNLAIVEAECSEAFALHNGSKLAGGVIHSKGTNVIVLDIGIENMQNVNISTAILGDYAPESVGVLFKASTGIQGSICFSAFESAIHGFENAYKFDRPNGNYPWVTFMNVSGILSGNKKAFTHNVSNYGLAFGSSTWNITLCGSSKWAGDTPLFDALGDNSTFNIKLSDIGEGHSQKIGIDFLHAMKSTVNCVSRSDERVVNISNHTLIFAVDNINEIALDNGVLYYTINGMCANCVYIGKIPKGGFIASNLPFSNLKTLNIPYCGNYATRVRTEGGWNRMTFINDTSAEVDVCLQFSTFII